MKKVCLDTNILVWGVKETANAGQEKNIPRAKFLFEYFDAKKITVIVPSLVLGELMGNVTDDDEREKIFDYISKNFQVVMHDTVASIEFAKMRVSLDAKNIKQYANTNSIPKCRMINDYNICSVAVADGCDAIFTHNLKDFEKFIDGKMPIYDIEHSDVLKAQFDAENESQKPPPAQGDLFEYLHNYKDDEDDEAEQPEVK